jgi:hypothetical protein
VTQSRLYAWIMLAFTDVPQNGATTCPRIVQLQVTPPVVDKTYLLSAVQQGTAMSDCAGIFVSPILSAADLTNPSPLT